MDTYIIYVYVYRAFDLVFFDSYISMYNTYNVIHIIYVLHIYDIYYIVCA